MNQVPDKPGLYWAKSTTSRVRLAELYLVEVSGKPPFLKARAFAAHPYFANDIFEPSPDTLAIWQWLGPVDVPGQENDK